MTDIEIKWVDGHPYVRLEVATRLVIETQNRMAEHLHKVHVAQQAYQDQQKVAAQQIGLGSGQQIVGAGTLMQNQAQQSPENCQQGNRNTQYDPRN